MYMRFIYKVGKKYCDAWTNLRCIKLGELSDWCAMLLRQLCTVVNLRLRNKRELARSYGFSLSSSAFDYSRGPQSIVVSGDDCICLAFPVTTHGNCGEYFVMPEVST